MGEVHHVGGPSSVWHVEAPVALAEPHGNRVGPCDCSIGPCEGVVPLWAAKWGNKLSLQWGGWTGKALGCTMEHLGGKVRAMRLRGGGAAGRG